MHWYLHLQPPTKPLNADHTRARGRARAPSAFGRSGGWVLRGTWSTCSEEPRGRSLQGAKKKDPSQGSPEKARRSPPVLSAKRSLTPILKHARRPRHEKVTDSPPSLEICPSPCSSRFAHVASSRRPQACSMLLASSCANSPRCSRAATCLWICLRHAREG